MLSLENRLKQYSNEQTSNIQVGGRNLMRFTKEMSGTWTNRENWTLQNENYNELSIYRSNFDWGGITQGIQLQEGEIYTLSLYVRKQGNITFYLFVSHQGKVGSAQAEVVSTNSEIVNSGAQNTWYRVYVAFRVTQSGFCFVRPEKSGSGYIDVCGFKLEKGNIPTDWSPAPEDVENQISTAQTATEAYARAQAELTKTQAIANADGKITEAEQRQIQQLQQKLQEAKTFAEQKVNELNIGGRNLVLNSKNKRTMNGYTGTFYLLSEPVKVNEQYILSCITERNGFTVVYFSNEYGGERQYISSEVTGLINGKSSILTTPNRAWKGITIFHEVSGVIPPPISSIELLKLERGNKPTDWSPAPEDVWGTMVDLGIIDKNAAAINEAEKANIKYINGIFSKGADYTNGTETIKNTITTGALTVGNTLGGNAGINGAGLDGKSIRFFAGKPYSQKEQAPFRVDDNGELWATNAHISGQVNATSGQIGQFYINTEENEKRGRIYAGSSDTSEIEIGNRGIIVDSRSSFDGLFASFGDFNAAVGVNTYIAQKIEYIGRSYNRIGSYIKIRPNHISSDNALAQFIDGNISSIGKRAIYEDGYVGTAYTSTIVDNIKYTHTYIFTGVASTYMYVNLPNAERIRQITGNSNISFEITIIMAHSVGGSKIVVQGVPNGYILDNDGGHAEGGDGYIDMARGDTMKLRFCEGNYYIVSLRR